MCIAVAIASLRSAVSKIESKLVLS